MNIENSFLQIGLSPEELYQLEVNGFSAIMQKVRRHLQGLTEKNAELEKTIGKMQRDLKAAREAQLNMLPKEIKGVPNLRFAAIFQPSQYVSGDIYNVFRLDERHIGIYHIDISGHGVPAALFSVSLAQMLNSNVSSRNLLKVTASAPPYYRLNPPDEVIRLLDEDQYFDNYGIFFTMVYLIMDFTNGQVQLGRAGHSYPLLLRSSGDYNELQNGGIPVGLGLPREDYIDEFTMRPGDRLFLYSDGMIEAVNQEGEQYRSKRLISHLLENRTKPVTEQLQLVLNDIHNFSGQSEFDDDISIVGIEFC